MFDAQRYEITKETIEGFKSDSRLTDIEILLTEEEAKRLKDEEPQLLEGLDFGYYIDKNSESSYLKQYYVSKH